MERSLKILLLSVNSLGRRNWGHQRFLDDLTLINDVVYYGLGYEGYNPKLTVPEVIKKYGKFDIIFTNHWGWKTRPLKWSYKVDIPHVHLLLDYVPTHKLKRLNRRFKKYRFDLILARTSRAIELLEKNNINVKSRFFPFSVDTEVYKKQKVQKIYDVITSSSRSEKLTSETKYPHRWDVHNLVNRMDLKARTDLVVHFDYIKAINQSKIAIISNNIYKSLNMKYTEFLSCGTFVLADKPDDFEICGYKNKEHLVLYKDLQDLEKLIRYYLDHSEERERIAKQGMEFVRKYHSNEVRVKEMESIIIEELSI